METFPRRDEAWLTSAHIAFGRLAQRPSVDGQAKQSGLRQPIGSGSLRH